MHSTVVCGVVDSGGVVRAVAAMGVLDDDGVGGMQGSAQSSSVDLVSSVLFSFFALLPKCSS